jgi:hypothetical protein
LTTLNATIELVDRAEAQRDQRELQHQADLEAQDAPVTSAHAVRRPVAIDWIAPPR